MRCARWHVSLTGLRKESLVRAVHFPSWDVGHKVRASLASFRTGFREGIFAHDLSYHFQWLIFHRYHLPWAWRNFLCVFLIAQVYWWQVRSGFSMWNVFILPSFSKVSLLAIEFHDNKGSVCLLAPSTLKALFPYRLPRLALCLLRSNAIVLSLVPCTFCTDFLTVCSWSFHFFFNVFQNEDLKVLIKSSLPIFSFMHLACGVPAKKCFA